MYSRNDYRYYLEHQLMISDDYLAHYGVMGMKWGVRKDSYTRLSDRRASNSAKIEKYQQKLNTVGAKNRAAKAAKFKAKQDKYDRKAAKARKRLAQGKNISTKQLKRIAKAEKYRAKTAKYSAKNDKYQAKIAKYEKQNTRIDKKINRMTKRDLRYQKSEMRRLDTRENRVASAYEKKASKYSERGNTKASRRYSIMAKNVRNNAKLQRKALSSMSVSELRKERNTANRYNALANAAVSAATVPIAMATGAPTYVVVGTMAGNAYKQSSRIKRASGGK